MADVFISYARTDRVRTAQLAEALEARGWTVWWDPQIRAGEMFDEAIEREIGAAGCVVVLWSRTSIASEWVRNEASAAAERGALIPARIDVVQPPIEFRRRQTVDLSAWDGTLSHPGLRELTDAVAERIAPAAVAHATAPASSAPNNADPRRPASRQRQHSPAVLGLAASVLAALVGVGIGSWRALGNPQPPPSPTPVEPRPTPTVGPNVGPVPTPAHSSPIPSSGTPAGIGVLDFRWPGRDCWYAFRGDVRARSECGAGRYALQAGDYVVRPSSHAAFEPQHVTIRAGAETKLDAGAGAGTLDFRWPGRDCWYAFRGDVRARSECGAGRYALQAGDYVVRPSSHAAFEPQHVTIRAGAETKLDVGAGAGTLDFHWPGRDCWYAFRGDVRARSECGAGRYALQAGDYVVRPSGYAAFEPQRVTIRAGAETKLDAGAGAGTLDFRWPGKDCWHAYRGGVKALYECGAGKHTLQAGDYVIKPSSGAAFEPITVLIRRGQTTVVP